MAKNKYTKTLIASCIGYVVQALVNNLLPLLFVRFSDEFSFTAFQLSAIIFINFTVQIIVDCFSAYITLKFGQKKSTVMANGFCFVGFLLLGTLPRLINPFVAVVISVVVMATGSGFIEVIISPIVDALPLDNKSGAMNFLHSFYCFGHIFTVVFATAFFEIFGIGLWRFLPLILAVIPLANGIMFLGCPILAQKGDENPQTVRQIFKAKDFFVFIILMISAGASEQVIAQWSSYFAETALSLPNKTIGDLLGTCLFAFGMAISRLGLGILGDKINLKKAILLCAVGLTFSYLIVVFVPNSYISVGGIALSGFFVGIMWPSVYSVAGRKSELGGTKMFGLLALGGDMGCTIGPSLIGNFGELKYGILCATVFPILIIISILYIMIRERKKDIQNK